MTRLKSEAWPLLLLEPTRGSVSNSTAGPSSWSVADVCKVGTILRLPFRLSVGLSAGLRVSAAAGETGDGDVADSVCVDCVTATIGRHGWRSAMTAWI